MNLLVFFAVFFLLFISFYKGDFWGQNHCVAEIGKPVSMRMVERDGNFVEVVLIIL